MFNCFHSLKAACLALLLCGAAAASADSGTAAVAYYIDPVTGSDAASGNSKDDALRTLEGALAALGRHAHAALVPHDYVLRLRGGVHRPESVVTITPELSAAFASLLVTGYDGEVPVLSGGRVLNPQWTQADGQILKAEIGAGLAFRQLYAGGGKATRARTPNAGTYLQLTEGLREDGFAIVKGVLDGVEDLSQVELSVKCKWMHKRLHVDAVRDARELDLLLIQPEQWGSLTKAPQGSRSYKGEDYWFENALEFLDEPGEWYYDSAGGILYYWPEEGAAAPGSIVIPVLESIVVLGGTLEQPVRNVRFDGIVFEHTGWTRPSEHGFNDVQANTLVPVDYKKTADPQYRHNQKKDRIPAALHINSGSRITVANCTFRELGGTALVFNNGGNDNAIISNRFLDVAASGVEIGNDAYRPQSDAMWPRRYLIFNNHVERIGTEYFGSIAIKAFYVDSITIENNLIRDVPYTGIDVGWGWFTSEVVLEARNALVRRNLVDTYMTELRDGAGIYSPNPVFGSVIEENYILNMCSPWNDPAIYNDGSGAYWLIRNNVIEKASLWTGQQSWGGQRKRDILASGNFSTTARASTYGVNRVTDNLTVVPDAHWPQPALDIIAAAGLTDKPAPPLPQQESEHAIVVDNDSAGFSTDAGGWDTNMAIMSRRSGYYGKDYAYTGQSALVQGKYAQWQPQLSKAGYYHVYIRYPVGEDGAEYVPVEVVTDGQAGEPVFISTYDQRNPVYGSRWIFLGRFYLDSTDEPYVRMLASGSGVTVADAVKFVKLEDVAGQSDALNLAALMQTVPQSAKFEEEGYYVWCGSALRGADDRYHLYYSRWPKQAGFQSWVTHSEIAHAVGDSPTGPFEPVGVVLGPREDHFWDAHVAHNPSVHFFNGRYYLYYMGNRGDGVRAEGMHELNWVHRNNQRIGVAVADAPEGPWQRLDEPVLDVGSGAADSDSLCVTNPSVTRMADGRFLMIYKAVGQERPLPFGGPVVHRIAIAERPEGPFVKLPEPVFTVAGNDFPAEDPFVWYDAGRDRYYAIVKDQSGGLTGSVFGLALLVSPDGIDWRPADYPLVTGNVVNWDSGTQPVYRLERPQLLIEDGHPVALYVSVLDAEEDGEAFNVQIPLTFN